MGRVIGMVGISGSGRDGGDHRSGPQATGPRLTMAMALPLISPGGGLGCLPGCWWLPGRSWMPD